MNTLKLGLAVWLCLLLAVFHSAKADSFPLPDSTQMPVFYADSTVCNAWVSLPVSFGPDCPVASYTPSLQIDLDIQDLDQDGQITPADVMTDIANPEDYFRKEGELF